MGKDRSEDGGGLIGSKKSSGGVMGKEVSVQKELEEEARGIGKVTSLKLGFKR